MIEDRIALLNACISEIEKNCIISYASEQEDFVLYQMLSHIENGFYVDVGCSDANWGNVTRLFYDKGWKGINIDPFKPRMEHYDLIRPNDINLCMAISNKAGDFKIWLKDTSTTFDEETVERLGRENFTESVVKVATLNQIFERHCQYRDVHFLKIDVEHHEAQVLECLDLRKYRPFALCVESTLPYSTTPCWQEWEPLLFAHGYEFMTMRGVCRYYVAHERLPEVLTSLRKSVGAPCMRYVDLHKLSHIKSLMERDILLNT